jgi:hypothetical protein
VSLLHSAIISYYILIFFQDYSSLFRLITVALRLCFFWVQRCWFTSLQDFDNLKYLWKLSF